MPSDAVVAKRPFCEDLSVDFWALKSEIVAMPMEMNSSKRLLVVERTSSSRCAISRSVTLPDWSEFDPLDNSSRFLILS